MNSCRGPVYLPFPGARSSTVGTRALIVMASILFGRVTAGPISETDAFILGLKYGFPVVNTLAIRSERANSVPTLGEHIFLRVGRALDLTDYTRAVLRGRKAKPVPAPFDISPALHFIAASVVGKLW